MNVKELIEKYKRYEGKWNGKTGELARQIFLEDLKQLEEPKPVKVQQFVSDWYEENKEDFETSLFQCIYDIYKYSKNEELNEFENWIIDENTKPFQTLVNMHQFGYEVEKRYYVRFKWIEDSYSYLTFIKHLHSWTLTNIKLDKKFRSEHTRKELEAAGFGWVFDCPGIEIEEVQIGPKDLLN